MAVTPAFIDELRNRLTLSDLVGRRVKLAPKGGRLAGLCPFHNEKTASFYVNDTEGCLLYTSPSPRDGLLSRMPSSA